MFISNFNQFKLNESIHDRVTLKAVFLVGGPGSGKTTVAHKMFAGLPFKVVDSDRMFEFLLKKNKLSMKIDQDNEEQVAERKHVDITFRNMDKLIDEMLPLIIDGTGKHYDKIKTQKEMMEAHGYDTFVLVVNVPIDIAIARDANRERSLGAEQVERQWHAVQENIEKYAELFDHRLYVVSGEISKKGEKYLDNVADKIVNLPLTNPIGKWIMRKLHDVRGSYLHDLKEPIPKMDEL